MKKIKDKVYRKLLVIFFISMFVISVSTTIQAKYIFQNEFYIANINIDRTKPKIELVSVQNSNIDYKNYANKTHTITIKLKITDKNLKNVSLDKEHIKTKIDNKYIDNVNVKSSKIQDIVYGAIYNVELSNICCDGKLKVEVIEGAAEDAGNLQNEPLDIETNIIIDNIAPAGKLFENKISDGKVNATIKVSEKIRELNGWNFSNDKLSAEKKFTNNISYELPIFDYAGNKAIIEINITQASYINIVYTSHNSNIGWTFGYGNYDIAGSEAVRENPKFKTEALAFNVTGNIDDDFLQVNAYVHTYWGEGSMARCTTSNMLYSHGYNPSINTYKSMKSNDLVTIKGKKYFQLGGGGINALYATDINGNKPVPASSEYYYGISGIKIKLKDYSQFAVVYQILVNDVGWVSVCSDGQECMYAKDKPMSAFRIALIPKSEKQYVIDTWNKDVGTFNLK